MSVEVKSCICPACGASLSVEAGRKRMFCSYCGAEILVANENEYVDEHIYRHIDDADIKRAETDQLIRLRKMELLEIELKKAQKDKTLKIILCLILGVIGLVCVGVGFTCEIMGLALVGEFAIIGVLIIIPSMKKDKIDVDLFMGDMVKVPDIASNFENKNYEIVEGAFVGAGFTNVRSVPLNDLTFGLLTKPGMVASISINGEEINSSGKKFLPNAMVIISYHSR